MSLLQSALTLARLAIGPVIAALVLWAANELYSDRLLAGFIYALCCLLLVLSWGMTWLAEVMAKRSALARSGGLDRAADGVLIAALFVSLAYASLPLMLVAAAVIILASRLIEAYAREPDGNESELARWRAAAEMAGLAAFLAFQAAAILFAPGSVVVGLDWAARLLLWAAAALALIGAAQAVRALLRRA